MDFKATEKQHQMANVRNGYHMNTMVTTKDSPGTDGSFDVSLDVSGSDVTIIMSSK